VTFKYVGPHYIRHKKASHKGKDVNIHCGQNLKLSNIKKKGQEKNIYKIYDNGLKIFFLICFIFSNYCIF
jgi:hypothetical protein